MNEPTDNEAKESAAESALAAFAKQFEGATSSQPDANCKAQAEGNPETNSKPATFDTDKFLKGLDDIYEAHKAKDDAEDYLQQAMVDAENAGDDAGLLTVLNETMGFYRSHGRHDDNQWIIQRALELGLKMRIEGTEAWTTTLINAATGMRAAKRYDQAAALYDQAMQSAKKTYTPNDRRMAALHNNISMLYSETGDLKRAQQELEEALGILTKSSTDASQDLDVASTHTNLALVLLQRAQKEHDPDLIAEALRHATTTLDIYKAGHLEHSAHYASALAGYAQASFMAGRLHETTDAYEHSLAVIAECYGKDTDYYRITAQNLNEVQQALKETKKAEASDDNVDARQSGNQASHTAASQVSASTAPSASSLPSASSQSRPTQPSSNLSGIQLARAYWKQVGKPMVAERYPDYVGRIAVGLVGHGSECYGFDDELSHDHDFGPRFCMWLNTEDYTAIGEQLEDDYEALPQDFMGFTPRESTARAQGANRRDGVFEVGTFFESITGYRQAPAEDKPHEWLLLDEPTLAAATNGSIFADPVGLFSKTRQGFKFMPDDVRLSLISRRLGMIAQAGQYNLPRMLQRGDGAAAWLSIQEFATNVCSLVFLINRPVTAGYMPYYKWQFAALRRLSSRTATRLKDVCEQLECILRLSSAACFGGAGFGEGGKGSGPAMEQVQRSVERICAEIAMELKAEGLTTSDETFLEWQRPYVEEHISATDPVLHSL